MTLLPPGPWSSAIAFCLSTELVVADYESVSWSRPEHPFLHGAHAQSCLSACLLVCHPFQVPPRLEHQHPNCGPRSTSNVSSLSHAGAQQGPVKTQGTWSLHSSGRWYGGKGRAYWQPRLPQVDEAEAVLSREEPLLVFSFRWCGGKGTYMLSHEGLAGVSVIGTLRGMTVACEVRLQALPLNSCYMCDTM